MDATYAQIATTAVCTLKASLAMAGVIATLAVTYYRINRYGIRA